MPGNTPIIIGGVEIGYMLINLQWLRPEAWRGLGAIVGFEKAQQEVERQEKAAKKVEKQ